MIITLRIPGVPVAQPRAKATSFGGRTRVYNPTQTVTRHSDGTKTKRSNGTAEFKAAIRIKAEAAYSGTPLVGPLRVDVLFVFPRQAAKVWKSKPMPRYRHTTKPDRDNLDKIILDSLKGSLWVDDCQVCAGSIDKWHAAGDEAPHVVITVTRISETETKGLFSDG